MDANNMMFFTMLSAWGIELKDDGLLYIRGSNNIADGEFKHYLPKFMGFGTTDKIGSIGIIKKGELVSWKRFNKFGDEVDFWNKD